MLNISKPDRKSELAGETTIHISRTAIVSPNAALTGIAVPRLVPVGKEHRIVIDILGGDDEDQG